MILEQAGFIPWGKLKPSERLEQLVLVSEKAPTYEEHRLGMMIHAHWTHHAIPGMYYVVDRQIFVRPYDDTTRIEVTTSVLKHRKVKKPKQRRKKDE